MKNLIVAIFRSAYVLLLIGLATPAFSVVFDPVLGTKVDDLQVPINQSRILIFDQLIENLSVGNPEVADVLVLESRKIYIIGKSLGSTNVVVWGKNSRGKYQRYDTFKVEVTYDLDGLKRILHKLMPNENPQVQSTEGAIILSGHVSSPANMDAIMVLATQFVHNTKKFSLVHKKNSKGGGGGNGKENAAPSEVINLMTVGGPHQVMLKVKVAEVSRSVLQQFGINLANYKFGSPWIVGSVNGGASFPDALDPSGLKVPVFPKNAPWTNGNTPIIGPDVDSFVPTTPAISSTGLFASYLKGNNFLSLIIDASKNDGLAKILAEPTLTTLSGEPASFLSGGEFPVPVWGGNDKGVSVKFKEFGISVKVLPLVIDTGRIKLTLNISVSELTDAAGVSTGIPSSDVNIVIPSLATRSATSTVELMDGQTIGIAGLISDKMRESIDKFPGLGDIPVLGALFRSQSYIQDKSELVMFVTAHLAKPINAENIKLPTEAFVDPSTAGFFLLGRMQGLYKVSDHPKQSKKTNKNSSMKNKDDDSVRKLNTRGGTTFGHDL